MINKAEIHKQNKLVETVRVVKRATETMKTTQRVGADSLVVTGSPDAGTANGIATIAAGADSAFQVVFTPASPILSTPDLYVTIYVDNDNTAGYIWRNGSSLSAGQKKLRVTTLKDWAQSDDTLGVRTFQIVLENYDTVAHTYYLKTKLYVTKNPATTA